MWKPLYLNVGFRLVSPDRRGKWLCTELQKAGPVYVKLGQFISNRSDIFGSVSSQLSSLRDQVTPVPYEQIKDVIYDENLVNVDKNPIASASISQIHTARLKRNGKKVVIKVKRPGIKKQFDQDLNVIETFLKIVDPSMIDTVFAEFKESFQKETDFATEIKNLKMFGDIYNTSTLVKVPKVYPEYSNNERIVMEYIPPTGKYDKSFAIRIMNMFLQQILFEGVVHGDLHAGNVAVTSGDKLVMYDFGNIIKLEPEYQNMIRQLIQAIQNQNQDEIYNIMVRMGMKINDESETRKFIKGYLEYINTVDVKSFSTLNFTSRIPVQFDRTTFQIIRTTGLVEGTCKTFDPDFKYEQSILLCIELLALGF